MLDRRRSSGVAPGAGAALALGALLDGIPEQAVLGIGLAAGEGVSVSLLAAIFVSNLPEAIGAVDATCARAAGPPRRSSRCGSSSPSCARWRSVVGYALADATGGDFRAAINGFAAGALLVMLVDSMIPEATAQGRRIAGLVTVLGFAVAAGLA